MSDGAPTTPAEIATARELMSVTRQEKLSKHREDRAVTKPARSALRS